ncbi:unnamed protein product, partial [Strongylus vulgaris]
KDDLPSLIWVCAGLSEQENELQERLELELADRLTAVDDGVDVGLSTKVIDAVNTLLCILIYARKDLRLINQEIVQLTSGYILLQIAVASGEHDFMVHNVYTGLIKRMDCSTQPFIELALSLISEGAITCDRHALLVKILYDLLDECSEADPSNISSKMIAYLGQNPLQIIQVRRSSNLLQETDTNKLISTIHEYRLKLLLK